MFEMDDSYTFTAAVDIFNSKLWGHHILVPNTIAQVFVSANILRISCTLNDSVEFQTALMPKGEGQYFININKKLRDNFRLKVGSAVQATIRPDESSYGLPMPEEFWEVLQQNETGNQLFHALTPGKQRTLLYIVRSVKNPDLRISKALVIVEHLISHAGKIDYKQLHLDLKHKP